MKYILMCGGDYKFPKHLSKINGEVLVERTIRLLRENGVNDIAISTNSEMFNNFGVEILKNANNQYTQNGEYETKQSSYSWLNAYYPIEEEVCYIHGDVYFSNEAIKTIVDTRVDDTMFFCVPDTKDIDDKDIRNPKGREPLAYKVKDYKLFRNAINDLLQMIDNGDFNKAKCKPIAWTVYRYLNGLDIGKNAQNYGDLNNIFDKEGKYTIINDYTTDIDNPKDIARIEKYLKFKGGKMIKVEALMDFRLGAFDKIKDITRRNPEKNEKGMLYKEDTFICDEAMAEYLMNDNPANLTLVKVIEVIPEKQPKEEVKEEPKEEIKPIRKTIRKKTTKK